MHAHYASQWFALIFNIKRKYINKRTTYFVSFVGTNGDFSPRSCLSPFLFFRPAETIPIMNRSEAVPEEVAQVLAIEVETVTVELQHDETPGLSRHI